MSDDPRREDDTKQVEFLQSTFLRYSQDQDQLYEDLHTKMTFLFGFVVTVMTVYGSYASHANSFLKFIALSAFAVSILFLCAAFKTRDYSRAPMLDAEIKDTTYFDKVYQDVSNLEKICDDNKKPLKEIEEWLNRAIIAFTVGVLALALSFITPLVLEFLHEQYSDTVATTTTKTCPPKPRRN